MLLSAQKSVKSPELPRTSFNSSSSVWGELSSIIAIRIEELISSRLEPFVGDISQSFLYNYTNNMKDDFLIQWFSTFGFFLPKNQNNAYLLKYMFW